MSIKEINGKDFTNKEIAEYLKAIVICKQITGEYLVDIILDSDINPVLLSSFVAALSLFGADSLGKIEEISVKGLDVEMIVINKYNLILVTIVDKKFVSEGIREEAELALDMFYSSYQEEINGTIEISKFYEFKNLLYFLLVDFFNKIEKESEIGDFGFFTSAIKKLKNDQNGN